uniref:Putative gametoproteintin-binding protein 2 n=1 Tax=Panstrongylus lignarius TaxID=156445 RepID=A0A224X9X1_9HEMI
MAKLVEVYRSEKQKLTKRQLPLVVDDNLTMVMDINGMGLICGHPFVRGKEMDKFADMFNTLTPAELRDAFEVQCKDFFSALSQTVPCVGCRRSVERLYEQLRKTGHPAMEPLVIKPDGNLTIKEDHFEGPRHLFALLHGHSTRLNQLVENQLRSKRSRRCVLHSLDYQKVRAPWKEIWDIMRPQCREEVLRIDARSLMITLECYLQKHRFCADCRTKVLRAYWLLVEEPEPTREKGYIPALYAGIKRCLPEKHIHLLPNTDYVSALVARVQPDIMGSGGERHAKTLEIAQGEVITCLGLCVYERLQRIHMRLKEEETICQVLVAVAIDALNRKFQIAVDMKRGMTELELLYKQLTKEELVKRQRKEQKKLKRKKRKERKAEECRAEVSNVAEDAEKSDIYYENCELKNTRVRKCSVDLMLTEEEMKNNLVNEENSDVYCTCRVTEENMQKKSGDCLCEYSHDHDCGYSSGNNNASTSSSTPEGSEVACCDEFCNEGVCKSISNLQPSDQQAQQKSRFTLSLEQMLEDSTSSDEEGYIPLEDVKEFQSRVNIAQKREELRQTLRMRFQQLCVSHKPDSFTTSK